MNLGKTCAGILAFGVLVSPTWDGMTNKEFEQLSYANPYETRITEEYRGAKNETRSQAVGNFLRTTKEIAEVYSEDLKKRKEISEAYENPLNKKRELSRAH